MYQGFGTLSFGATTALLTGIVEVTFEELNQGMYISVINLFPFLEKCARNLSDLLLQQTLLEHRVLHSSSSERNLQRSSDSSSLLISQSTRLFEKCDPSFGQMIIGCLFRYVKHPIDLELVMSAIWKDRWTGQGGGYSSPTEEVEIQQQEMEVTSMHEILPSLINPSNHDNPSNPQIGTQPPAPGQEQDRTKSTESQSCPINQVLFLSLLIL